MQSHGGVRVRTGAAGRWHSPDSTTVLCAVLSTALLCRVAAPALWQGPTVQAWTTIFAAVCIQATPYVVLGVMVSVAVAVVSTSWLRRALPQRAVLAVPVAALAGSALPGCECGSVPVATSLLRRGVPPGPAVAFMLAAPATNPVVLAATAAAYPGRPGMVLARFCASLGTALVVGIAWHRRRPTLSGEGHRHDRRPAGVAGTAAHDLTQSLGLLTIGAASAATINVVVPRSALAIFASTAAGAILAMAALAVVLAVCSEADAFIASSLTQFSPIAQLTFMVVGPVVDVKLAAMEAGAFGGRFAARLCLATLVVAVASAVGAGLAFT